MQDDFTPEQWAAARARVRVRTHADGTLTATIDRAAEPAWRTNAKGEGLWWYGNGSSDGYRRLSDGRTVPVCSWHQSIGTSQLRGKAAFRRKVVSLVAYDMEWSKWDAETTPSWAYSG